MKKIFRILLGFIFIVSGAVKAIDPKGFSFKLDEYFSPSVFDMPWLEPYTLVIAIIVVALEIIFGAMLLLGIKLKFTISSLVSLCIFFAFLTFYSAYYDKVTDCGCFGDAIKFTPWQSFFKDIILLFGLIILYFGYRNEKSLSISHPISIAGISSVILVSTIVIYWGITYEPIIDFRAYKIGTNISEEKKKIKANPDEYQNIYIVKDKTTGKEKPVSQDDFLNNEEYWKEGTIWEIQSEKTQTKLVKEGYSSEIKKFKIEKNGNDITEEILNMPEVYLLFSYNPKAISEEEKNRIQDNFKNKKNVFVVTTVANSFTKIPEMYMDETAIKTIARSNPFLLILKNGIIIEKKGFN